MKCRRCPADIIWIENDTTGRAMPVNARPHPQGNIELSVRADSKRVGHVYGAGRVLDEKRAAGVPLYLNHYADCPAADSFRKGKR